MFQKVSYPVVIYLKTDIYTSEKIQLNSMDTNTQRLLTVVICFSMATKIYKDIITLLTGIPQLLHILTVPIKVPIVMYIAHVILFMMTLIGAFIVPINLIKYFVLKDRIAIGREFTFFMFKPQLYCAVLGIAQWVLSYIFALLIGMMY